jgi:hypothetical protein
MSEERGAELFRALHASIDAVTNLNLRDLEAEAKASSSSSAKEGTSSKTSAKGKAKDSSPNWTEVPYNPVPITPLSTRPHFSQVVGSSSESSIVPPSRVVLEATSLVSYPALNPATIAAWAAMSDQTEGQNQGGQRNGQGGPQDDGGGGIGDGQGGGGQPPLVYHNAAQFLAAWNATPSDQANDNLEQEAISWSPAQDVQFAAMLKINLRMQALVVRLNTKVKQAQGQVAAANQIARQTQAAAQVAANVDRFRPAAPPKYGDKKKGEHVGHWIPVIEDYLRTALDADYIRLAFSYLEGGPRALWTNVYEASKRANGGAEPPNPRQFFRQTLEANYGLHDLDQKYWDTWNSLRMGPSQSVTEYYIDFQQALTDLAGHVTDEQVRIENYRAGLQHDLRQLCRTSLTGAKWARLQNLMQFATLLWPMVQERIAKSKNPSKRRPRSEGRERLQAVQEPRAQGAPASPS